MEASSSKNALNGNVLPTPAELLIASRKRSRAIFQDDELPISSGLTKSMILNDNSKNLKANAKIHLEYKDASAALPNALTHQQKYTISKGKAKEKTSDALIIHSNQNSQLINPLNGNETLLSTALIRKKEAANRIAKPTFHPQWKLSRVMSGHLGWIRCICVDPENKWFATGAGDRMIKIWDLATGELKASFTGHISTIRGLAVSDRHPYLFSASEDKLIKCWDLETNKVVRQYIGHLTGVYSLALHPTLDVLVSGGRDSVVRVWDMRTKSQIHVLTGHKNTIASLVCQEADPQIISGSLDSTVRLWDLAAGKSITTLTHHKKSIRSLALHPMKFSFASASTGQIKTWQCPEGILESNINSHEGILNSVSINPDGVLFSGSDDGSMKFFDFDSGKSFQSLQDIVQPGSMNVESGIFCSTFDQTGTRLLCGGADKTIKVYKEMS